MSQFVIYVKLPLYKAEWLKYHFGDPVVFPPCSPYNADIRAYLQPKSSSHKPDLNIADMTAIAIPYSKAKPPERYNYMGPRGKEVIVEDVDDLFRRALWNDISPLNESAAALNKHIAAWCELNGITLDNVETVRQYYYRIRKKFAEKGVNLIRKTRKRSDA